MIPNKVNLQKDKLYRQTGKGKFEPATEATGTNKFDSTGFTSTDPYFKVSGPFDEIDAGKLLDAPLNSKDSLCTRCQGEMPEGMNPGSAYPPYPIAGIIEQFRKDFQKDMEFQRARTETIMKMLSALTKNIEEL